jgi:signal recognition particle receptor subunit beta
LENGRFSDSIPTTVSSGLHQVRGHKLFDTSGNERFRSILLPLLPGADGVFVFFRITSRNSFRKIPSLITFVRAHSSSVLDILLVGTHADLADAREVDTEEARVLADSHGIAFTEISNVTGSGVWEALSHMERLVHARRSR